MSNQSTITKQIESSSVIRLILQFLKESNLQRSLQCLQEETGVSLNAVDNIEAFQRDILKGKWDVVIQTLGTMEVSEETLYSVYEQIIFELAEALEFGAALILLRETAVMQALKSIQPQRYKHLDSLVTSGRTSFEKKDLYGGATKDKRRHILAKSLAEELQQVTPSRLLSLLGMALRWQNEQGLIPEDSQYDIFRGSAIKSKLTEVSHINRIVRTIKMGKKSAPQAVAFSPNGKYLVTGSFDGLVEIWDWMTGQLAIDLEYQKNDFLIAHESAVLALSFDMTSKTLATGCRQGDLKIWNVEKGSCVHNFSAAHDAGISSISFHPDGSHVLTTSYDMTAKCFGLHSSKLLRVYKGHTSYVNSGSFNHDGTRVITASSDGTVKVWDSKVADCLLTYSPPVPVHMNESMTPPINTVILVSKELKKLGQDSIIVCTKSNTVYLLNISGVVIKKYSTGQASGTDFVTACVSHDNQWVYCAGEDFQLYSFSVMTGTLHSTKKVHDKDILGIAHHPNLSVLATISFDGNVNILSA